MLYRMFVLRLLLVFIVKYGESARILAVFPYPAYSHQIVFRSLVKELVNRNHEVVVITTNPAYPKGETPPNLKEIDVHDLSYEMMKKELVLATGKKSDLMLQIKTLYAKASLIVEKQFQSAEVQKLINDKSQSFDLLILELFPTLASLYAHIYKVPVIHFSSFGPVRGSLEMMGAPAHGTLYPVPSCPRVYNLTFWDKISMLYTKLVLQHYIDNDLRYFDNTIFRKSFGNDAPDIMDLRSNNSLMFLNTHSLWSFNRPLPKNVINLWGIHQQVTIEIPKDLQNYLDNSKNGVVYVSFGTHSKPSSFPLNTITMLTKVFAQLPYDILLKWDEDELLNQPKNVRIVKWVPQPSLLRHPRIKLFVTQGGLQSTEEAINANVPLVTLPLLVDQWFNAEMCTFYKTCITLNFESFTEHDLKNAIDTVIEDPSYKENMIKLRTLMRDEANTALERAVWWTEYVLKHGAEHLRAPGCNISWTDYYELELILIITFAFVISLILSKYLLAYVVSQVKKIQRLIFKSKSN